MMTSPTYQPKGSMCRSCVHQFRDCRHLDFSDMVPMVGVGDTIIVKCTDHQPIVPKPTPPASQESAIAPGMYQDTEGKVPSRIGGPVGRYVQPDPFARQGEADFPAGTPRSLNELLHTLTAEVSRLTGELDAASARLHEVATLCATVEQERDRLTAELADRNKAVIAQAGNARALADALKTLTQAARISGGVAGADSNLMAACDKAENALSLTGVGCAVNAVLDVIEQRDSLRDECERLREENEYKDLQYHLLASEMVYEGNSVQHWEQKGRAYKAALGRAWEELEKAGIRPDGTISVADAIKKLAALSASGREGE